MRIASRISSLMLPLLIVPLAFVAFTSWFAAQDGITAVARQLQTFQLEELLRYIGSQQALLEASELSDRQEFREITTVSIREYATRISQDDSDYVFAVTGAGDLAFATRPVPPADVARIAATPPEGGWSRFPIGQQTVVGGVRRFEPFDWTVVVAQPLDAFFAPVERITRQSLFAGIVTVVLMLIMVNLVSRLITRPLLETVAAMRSVISTGDFTARVEARYRDETGELADSFNYMVESLDEAYTDIKRFAFQAACAERRESKIRTIFQRYVPQHVIDEVFERPENMLVGRERALSVLYSDIRGFTRYSESLTSQQVVESLNRYFGTMVEVVERNDGVVDKYIGDAVMAFFGAPVDNKRNPRNAVETALSMHEEMTAFNGWQIEHGRPPFEIGVAVNYGPVTVGNIGSERKMDYTVIGDTVNVAARLEGLTKVYRQPVLITESVRRHIRGSYAARMVDRVQVVGRERGLAIWTVQRKITDAETAAWKHYHGGLLHYYNREFKSAIGLLESALEILRVDYLCELFLQRSRALLDDPPDESWTGVVRMQSK